MALKKEVKRLYRGLDGIDELKDAIIAWLFGLG